MVDVVKSEKRVLVNF